MVKEINNNITIEFYNDRIAQIYFNSLLPESIEPFRQRAHSELFLLNNKLKISISAKDITALRATVNSYLNWIKIINDIIEIAE